MGKFKNKRNLQKQTTDKSRGGPPLSRKQKRKDIRKDKKAKKHNIFLKKHGKEIIQKSEENKNDEKGAQSSKSPKQSVSNNCMLISSSSK